MFIVIAAASLILSIVMSGIAWRLAREERRRSQARVAVLASDLADLELHPAAAAPVAIDLFRAEERARSGFRLASTVAVGGLAVVTALALIVVTSRHLRSAPGPRAAAGESPPLELVALDHEIEGDRIIVRGIVRNPKAGVERHRLAVAVFLFNRDGGFLGSGAAAVEMPALAAGSQSGFVVTMPHANEVGRYRVSFRSQDRLLPHVDRRNREPISQWQ
jgi:hypothetical protein